MSDDADDEPTRHGKRPWVAAVVLALVVAALTLLLVRTNTVRSHDEADAGTRLTAPTPDQRTAVTAAATTAANLTTLSRKNFASDFARALGGTTGKLRSDLLSHKSSYLSAMSQGKFDLKATIMHSAFETENGTGQVLVLVTINGARVVDGSPNALATPQRLELTMVRSGGKWLATNFVGVNIQ